MWHTIPPLALSNGHRAAPKGAWNLHQLRGGAKEGDVCQDFAVDSGALQQREDQESLAGEESCSQGDSQYGSDSQSSDSDAEWLYRDVLAKNPNDVMALGALADVLYSKGNVDGAKQCFENALTVKPDHLATLFSLGLLLLARGNRGDVDRATHFLWRAVEVDPTQVPALHMYGRLLHSLHGRLADAEDMYQRALCFQPNRGDILNDYGALLEAKGGDPDAVRGMYKRAVQMAPSHANALSNYARVLEAAGADGSGKGDVTQTALALYRRALAARPQHVPSLCNLALTLVSTSNGSTHEAKQLLQRALVLAPSHVGAMCQHARLLQEDGDAAEAQRLFSDALAIDPKCIDGLNGLGTILEARAQAVWRDSGGGDAADKREYEALLGKAENMYARALAIAPLHADTECNRGALLLGHRSRVLGLGFGFRICSWDTGLGGSRFCFAGTGACACIGCMQTRGLARH